jgi:hypothetical protein
MRLEQSSMGLIEKFEASAIQFSDRQVPPGETVIARAYASAPVHAHGGVPDFSNTLAAAQTGIDIADMIRTIREAKGICFTITDRSVIVCHRGTAGLGAWSHDFTLPREAASVVEFKRGILNDHILIDVGGIPIAMMVGRRQPKSARLAHLEPLRDELA